jgi:hypothetical protein
MKTGLVQMDPGNLFLICRQYVREETMIYDNMIFKSNHNLFEVRFE